MIRLPEGTKKYLLVDPVETRRNTERLLPGGPTVPELAGEVSRHHGSLGGIGHGPTVVVIEVIEDDGMPAAYKRHVCYGVASQGTVTYEYRQRDFVCLNYFRDSYPEQRKVRGAFMTTGGLLLAESNEEADGLHAASTQVAPKATKKSTKGNE